MDRNNILAFVAIGYLLVGDRVYAYFNQTYGVYSFILSNVSADNSQGKAQEWCRSNGYALATIPNEKAQNSIKLFIASAISNGLMNSNDLITLNGKLHTSLPGTWIWVNGRPINGVNVQDQRDLSQLYFYGFLKTSDYKIYASTHTNERAFICEKPGNSSDCVDGLSLKGICYQRKTSSLKWYSARNECLDGGGDLASFDTLSDSTFNSTLGSTLLADASQTEYWVGIQRAEWRWEDTDIAIKYTNWESGSPNNALLCFGLRYTSQWLWYSYDCSGRYRFICLATIPTSSTVSSDTSQTISTTASLIPPPSFHTSSIQRTSMPSMSSTRASLALPLGLGIGLGMGAILVVAIVLGVMFIRRRQKSKSSPYSENTTSSDATVRNGFKESDIDEDHEKLEANGIKKYDVSTGNASQGVAIYAAVQPNGTPANAADTHRTPIVYAPLDLIQNA